MTLIPNGRKCYCGKHGCVETYCSTDALLAPFGESLKDFFDALRNGESNHCEAWQHYLELLASAIYNYQIILSTEVLISGHVTQYMTEDDLQLLVGLTLGNSHLADNLPQISISRYNNAAAGAALYYIKDILQQYGGDGL